MSFLRAEIKKGEAKTLRFTYVDGDGVAIDVSGATFSFVLKDEKSDEEYVIEKTDALFVKTQAANGIVDLPLSETDLNITAKTYVGEVRARWSSARSDLSDDIVFIVYESVH